MKVYQSALVVALSASVVAANDCDTLETAVCGTDGLETVCELVRDIIFPTFKTLFAPTNDAFQHTDYEGPLWIPQQQDILDFHISAFEASLGCGDELEMLDSKMSTTVCNEGQHHQNGGGNIELQPIFHADQGIPVCGGATIYIVDQLLIPEGFHVSSWGSVSKDD